MFPDDSDEAFLNKSKIMVFHPTIEEFKNFSKYVEYMEEQGAAEFGVAKIIPPKGWKACKNLNEKLSLTKSELMIDNPVLQEISSTHAGIYQQMNVEQRSLSLESYEEMAKCDRHKPPSGSLSFLEQRYWRGLTFNPPLYGADVMGSLYDTDVEGFNIPFLGDVLGSVTSNLGVRIPGVNTPYLYFGMWRTTFPWHVEDMDLYSINYVHHGQPKFWYAIPQSNAKRFQTMIKGVYPDFFKVCPEFLRHKMTIVSPKNLARNGIPVNRMVQYEGEFMITFPNGYHSGFNMGFNAAESVNFALHRWVEIGKKSKFCVCYSDTVSINMGQFIDEYNQFYGMEVEKCPQKTPKKAIASAQNDELLRRMHPRRKLTEYRSENNTRAIARKAKFKRKMCYRNRKVKRCRSRVILKKHIRRACERNIVIDPVPYFDHEIIVSSDDESEECVRRTTRSQIVPLSSLNLIKIDLNIAASKAPKHQFPQKSWFLRAMGMIEKDFTLRAENVPLRSVYVKPAKGSPQSSTPPPTSPPPAEPETIVEQPKPAPSPKTKKSSRRGGSSIDLDIPDSFLLGESAPACPDPGLEDLFNDIVKSDEAEKSITARRSRKVKGGRPSKVEQARYMKEDAKYYHRSRGLGFETNSSVLWEPASRMDMPCTLSMSEFDEYHCTIETTEGEYEEPKATDEGPQSDWRLVMIQTKAKLDKHKKKEDYLGTVRKRGRPTFGSTGPSLCQAKINKINEEAVSRRCLTNKRISVKLKDLIIFDKKFIASKADTNLENRDKNGRVKLTRKCAVSGMECMRRIVWIFDHTYTVANTSLSPENIVTVPVGDNRYKVIRVNAEERKTKSFTGRSFVNGHAKWAPRVLSMGHNIMAIFNYQAYAGLGFTFDDTAQHPEPSVVREVSPDLCKRILEQREHIIKMNDKRRRTIRDCNRRKVGDSEHDGAESEIKHDGDYGPVKSGKRKRSKSPNHSEISAKATLHSAYFSSLINSRLAQHVNESLRNELVHLDPVKSEPGSPTSFLAQHSTTSPSPLSDPNKPTDSRHLEDRPEPRPAGWRSLDMFTFPEDLDPVTPRRTWTPDPRIPFVATRQHPRADNPIRPQMQAPTVPTWPTRGEISQGLPAPTHPPTEVPPRMQVPKRPSRWEFSSFDYNEYDRPAPGELEFSKDFKSEAKEPLRNSEFPFCDFISQFAVPAEADSTLGDYRQDCQGEEARPDNIPDLYERNTPRPQQVRTNHAQSLHDNYLNRYGPRLRVENVFSLQDLPAQQEEAPLRRNYPLRSRSSSAGHEQDDQWAHMHAADHLIVGSTPANHRTANQGPPLPAERHVQLNKRLEEHIDWSIKTNNVDQFRVWDTPRDNTDFSVFWPPPMQPMPKTRPTLPVPVPTRFKYQARPPAPVPKYHTREHHTPEDVNPNRCTRFLPAPVHRSSSIFPQRQVPEVLRKEGWRRFREQQINKIVPTAVRLYESMDRPVTENLPSHMVQTGQSNSEMVGYMSPQRGVDPGERGTAPTSLEGTALRPVRSYAPRQCEPSGMREYGYQPPRSSQLIPDLMPSPNSYEFRCYKMQYNSRYPCNKP